MINLQTVLLVILLILVGISILFSLGLANMMYNLLLVNKESGLQFKLFEKETITLGSSQNRIEASVNKIEKMSEVILTASETLVDIAGASAERPRQLRDGNFFTTDDGRIKATNINDFIAKLKNDPQYKDMADDLKRQLEEELEEEDNEEDSGYGSQSGK